METMLTDITGAIGAWLAEGFDGEVPNEVVKLLEEAYKIAVKEFEKPLIEYVHTKVEEKRNIAIWKHEYGEQEWYTIHEECMCNSLEEISYAYPGTDEVGLVNEVIKRGNKVMFTGDATYEEYLEQFEHYGSTDPIYPYCCFDTYEKAKEIFDLLNI